MSRLVFQSLADAGAVPRETATILGGFQLGQPLFAVDWPEQAIFAALPGQPAASVREIWRTGQACTSGEFEGIRWRRGGDVLFGVINLAEEAFADSDQPALQRASEMAYRRIFALLEQQQLPALWRVWNYLADINGQTCGLERYRQFNIGRQEAFIACQRASTGNVPAACALGLAGGPLSIAFLAGREAATPVENPRQLSAYHYPAEYGPRSPTFSRAALVYPEGQEILFISGTASIVGHRTVHAGDVAAQCREALNNILAVLAEANRLARHAEFRPQQLVYRSYVRAAADVPVVDAVLRQMIGAAADVVHVEADICRADLLVEIEACASHDS